MKPLNTASSDSELHRFRTKPLSNSLVNVANDVRFKQHSQDRDSLVSSSKQGILFSPIGLKHNVTEKVAQVGGLVRITAFLLYACLIFECHSALLCIRTILAYQVLGPSAAFPKHLIVINTTALCEYKSVLCSQCKTVSVKTDLAAYFEHFN